VKPHINSDEVLPPLSHNKHPVDGATVGGMGSLWLQRLGQTCTLLLQKSYFKKIHITNWTLCLELN
jgi:hypothetical protein